MKTTPEEVTQRFVDAYYQLYALRKVKNKKEFCEKVDIFPSNFVLVEKGKRSVAVPHICNLISNFNIKPNWIMLGIGEFRF